METYIIRNWNTIYENSESKKIKNCRYVCTPNKHDGKGYGRMASQKNACELFAAWNLIIQVASRCPVRGILKDQDGIRITSEDMEFKTRFPKSIFEKAFNFFSQNEIGWLEIDKTGHDPEISGQLPDRREQIEQKEGKRTEGREENLFDCFWNLYPKKKNKGDAEKAWKKFLNPSDILEKIKTALSWQIKTENWMKENMQYVPYPASYLNAKGWEDEPIKTKVDDYSYFPRENNE